MVDLRYLRDYSASQVDSGQWIIETMRKIVTTIMLMMAVAVSAQTAKRLRVYQQGGAVDTLTMTNGSTIAHSRLDLNGQQHPDYVTLEVTATGGTRRYLIADLDSLVLPNGHTVVFRGRTADLPLLQERTGERLGAPFRTSFSGTFPGGSGVTYYWTENDHIRLDVGYESRAKNLTNSNTEADFLFEDADLDADAYTVYYPDKQVTILRQQTQTGANNPEHIGPSGDCGVATATRDDTPPSGGDGGGSYSFSLQHKAAYLCFLPHIDHLPSAKVTRIELYCSNPIAGTYELSETGLYNVQSGSHTIALDLVPQQESDFFIGHDKMAEQDSVAAYMVIAPQDASRSFTVTYYVTDTLSRISKTYRQQLSFQPVANRVYPITFNISDADFHAIDLGLSCNWSNVNAGADDPCKSGPAYASDAEANAALLEQTVVTEWLMPDEDQCEEILEKCTWTRGTYGGVSGYFVEGATVSKEYGQKLRIFIPCAEDRTKEQCLAENYRPVEALMIDLGLPSGTKWAARNLGANSVEGYGDYYAWGEVEPKREYTVENYQYRVDGTYMNLGDDFDIAGTQNDAATVNWGGLWRMPNLADVQELSNGSYCQWEWRTINGNNGYLITGPNGNRIFLPAAGLMMNSSVSYNGTGLSYQTSRQGTSADYNYTLSARPEYSADHYVLGWYEWVPFKNWNEPTLRCYGRSIRPVTAPSGTTQDGMILDVRTDGTSWKMGDTTASLYGTLSSATPIKGEVTVGFLVGDSTNLVLDSESIRFHLHHTTSVAGTFEESLDVYDNIGYYYRAYVQTADTVFYGKARHYGYEMVDLGLSVKWANMNVGADQPSDYGYYYAWGEVETKDSYTASNYLYRVNGTYINLGDHYDIGGTENDAAHVNMGNAWRLPTQDEMNELINQDNCNWQWTTQDNVNGYRVTSKKEGYEQRSIFLPAAGIMIGSSLSYANTGLSYQTSRQGTSAEYNYTLSARPEDSSNRYVLGWHEWKPFRDWDEPTLRCYGRSVRAVVTPITPTADGLVLTVHTDSTSWRWGDSKARFYATLSSTTPLPTIGLTSGFLIGDDASLEKGGTHVLHDLQQQEVKAGVFKDSLAVHDNIGYWYRAYVATADTVIYGKARHYGLELVDLGLPSGTLWANMNVGANSPTDYGGYYAWGETEEKDTYSVANYQHYANGAYQNLGYDYDIATTVHDVARTVMGNTWQMPTIADMTELMNSDYCDWLWTTQDNVNGFLVTSKMDGYTDRSIFLPAAGFINGSLSRYASTGLSYLTSHQGTSADYVYTLASVSTYTNGERYLRGGHEWTPFSEWDDPTFRYFGRSVRAVSKPNAVTTNRVMNVHTDGATWQVNDTEATITGTVSSTTVFGDDMTVGFIVGNHEGFTVAEATDIPVTLTATGHLETTISITNNIGYWYRAYVACGGVIFYGEERHVGWEMVDLELPSGRLWANVNVGSTWPEDFGDYFTWGETSPCVPGVYAYSGQTLGNGNISGTNYDAARQQMGENWQMPVNADWQELMESANCTWTETLQNGVVGYWVKSVRNNRRIFLPAAGFYRGTSLVYVKNGGSYWSATAGSTNSYAYSLSWRYQYSTSPFLLGGHEWLPFENWDDPTLRNYGRSVRAVAVEH